MTLTVDADLMQRIAEIGGGRALAMDGRPDIADLFAEPEAGPSDERPLWPSLVAAALILFCIDLVLKRIRLRERRRRLRAGV